MEEIHAGPSTRIFTANRIQDETPVLIKALRARHPSEQDISRIRREYQFLKELKHPGIIRTLALEPSDNGLAMVMEDARAVPLSRARIESWEDWCQIALSITETLSFVHDHHIIHKDLKPDNILKTADGTRLIDFGIAVRLEQENTAPLPPARLEGTLSYISPEATGRINRPVDARSDLYSLGVTLYETLFGHPPYQGQDPLELVHAHLTGKPRFPESTVFGAKTPAAIVAIIERAMARDVSSRYQSARGLAHDLRAFLELARSGKTDQPFTAGLVDHPTDFHLPSTLFRRENEKREIGAAFARALAGGREILFISGHSGTGKTALISELDLSVSQSRGTFARGKFELLKRNIPYSGLCSAFVPVITSLLGESARILEETKERIIQATTPSTGLLTALIPELELITGPQSPPAALPPVEAENRFNEIFAAFLRTFTRRGRPLVLFLDDLQWADLPTFKLLRFLLAHPETSHLLLICAYRDNEIEDSHPLNFFMKEIHLLPVEERRLQLLPLKLPDVYRYVAAALGHREPEEKLLMEWVRRGGKLEDPDPDSFGEGGPELLPGHELALWLFGRTRGNPFLLSSMLRELHRKKLIVFDGAKHSWIYNLLAIRSSAQNLQPQVIISNILSSSSKKTLDVAQHAALLGHRFRLDHLAGLLDTSPLEVLQLLTHLIAEGLIVPESSDYKFILSDRSKKLDVSFRFAHDQIQEAIRSLSSERALELLHLKIGQYMLTSLSEEEQAEKLLEITAHLNHARNAITGPMDRLALANLNLRAGGKALAAAAPDTARELFRTGYELARGQEKERELLSMLIRTEVMTGENAAAESHIVAIQGLTRDRKELLKIYELRLSLLRSRDANSTLQAGREALNLARMRPPFTRSGSRSAIKKLARRYLKDKTLKILQDPQQEKAIIQNILMHMALPARERNEPYLGWIIVSILELAEKTGHAEASAFALSLLGPLLLESGGSPAHAVTLADRALQLARERNATAVQARVLYIRATFVSQHRGHIRGTLEEYQEGLVLARQSGDLYFLGRNAHGRALSGLCNLSLRLGRARTLLEESEVSVHRAGENDLKESFDLSWQFYFNLVGVSRNKSRLSGDRFLEEQSLPRWEERKFHQGLYLAYYYKTVLALLFSEFDQARDFALKAQAFESAVHGSSFLPSHRFRLALAFAATEHKETEHRLRGALLFLKNHQLEENVNYRHMALFLQAELARRGGDVHGAIRLYDESIAAALKEDFWCEAVLCMLRSASFYRELERHRFEAIYILDALATSRKYHARAIAEDIELRYPDLSRREEKERKQQSKKEERTIQTTVSTQTTGTADLDLLSVIKVSQAISGEIEFEQLLKKLISLVSENAGAEKCLLLRPAAGQELQVLARYSSGELSLDARSAQIQEIGGSVFHLARNTQSTVVVDDVEKDERTRHEAHPAQRRSLLIHPILQKKELKAYLVLENSSPGVFTADRVQTLSILSTQIATSLENAELYANLKEALAESQALHQASSRFVPNEFLHLLGKKNLVDVSLGDNIQREMAVFFSDIRGFTTLSEQMTPEDNFRFINSYLGKLGPVIREAGGFIDKYIGDAIMALFLDAGSAVSAALEIQRKLDIYNRARLVKGFLELRTGIGIHAGPLMLGTIGEADRMEGTVISDTVNLASRLESLTVHYGAAIIVSEHALKQQKSPRLQRVLDRVLVKGKKKALEIIEILDPERNDDQRLRLETAVRFEEARQTFARAAFAQAREQFLAIKAQNPADRACDVFLARINRLEGREIPAGWSGVNVLDSK